MQETHETRVGMRYGWVGRATVFAVLMSVGCVPQKVTVSSAPHFQPSSIRTVALLPFQALATPQQATKAGDPSLATTPEIRSQFRMPASPRSRSLALGAPHTVSPSAAKIIMNMVSQALEHRPGVRVVSQAQVVNALATVSDTAVDDAWIAKVKHLGAHLDVDAVLMGLVRTYREREGTKLGAVPAAVGFEIHLVNPADGRVGWSGEYYEEQKPMTEDVLGFVERGGTFVTAHELAQYGVRHVMKEFPVGRP